MPLASAPRGKAVINIRSLAAQRGDGKARSGWGSRRMSGNEIAVLRIEMLDTEPLVWRRVAVETSIDLAVLHAVVQAAMGWRDCHLWEFSIGRDLYGMPDRGGCGIGAQGLPCGPRPACHGSRERGADVRVCLRYGRRLAASSGSRARRPAEAGAVYPDFRGGERRCPPEDCGGIAGYYEFLEIIEGKNCRRKKQMLGWYGGAYDPDGIDEARIQAELSVMACAAERAVMER